MTRAELSPSDHANAVPTAEKRGRLPVPEFSPAVQMYLTSLRRGITGICQRHSVTGILELVRKSVSSEENALDGRLAKDLAMVRKKVFLIDGLYRSEKVRRVVEWSVIKSAMPIIDGENIVPCQAFFTGSGRSPVGSKAVALYGQAWSLFLEAEIACSANEELRERLQKILGNFPGSDFVLNRSDHDRGLRDLGIAALKFDDFEGAEKCLARISPHTSMHYELSTEMESWRIKHGEYDRERFNKIRDKAAQPITAQLSERKPYARSLLRLLLSRPSDEDGHISGEGYDDYLSLCDLLDSQRGAFTECQDLLFEVGVLYLNLNEDVQTKKIYDSMTVGVWKVRLALALAKYYSKNYQQCNDSVYFVMFLDFLKTGLSDGDVVQSWEDLKPLLEDASGEIPETQRNNESLIGCSIYELFKKYGKSGAKFEIVAEFFRWLVERAVRQGEEEEIVFSVLMLPVEHWVSVWRIFAEEMIRANKIEELNAFAIMTGNAAFCARIEGEIADVLLDQDRRDEAEKVLKQAIGRARAARGVDWDKELACGKLASLCVRVGWKKEKDELLDLADQKMGGPGEELGKTKTLVEIASYMRQVQALPEARKQLSAAFAALLTYQITNPENRQRGYNTLGEEIASGFIEVGSLGQATTLLLNVRPTATRLEIILRLMEKHSASPDWLDQAFSSVLTTTGLLGDESLSEDFWLRFIRLAEKMGRAKELVVFTKGYRGSGYGVLRGAFWMSIIKKYGVCGDQKENELEDLLYEWWDKWDFASEKGRKEYLQFVKTVVAEQGPWILQMREGLSEDEWQHPEGYLEFIEKEGC